MTDPTRPGALTFVVGTGRSGSTALSRVLRLHPDVLSLNELWASVTGAPAWDERPLSGADFWERITAPTQVFDALIRSGAALPEFLYNRHPEWRYSAETTGIPALSLMVLPHLSDDPDALLDDLEPEVRALPTRPVPDQWRALFDALAARLGGRQAVVERSGYSLGKVPDLHRLFPEARFVHLFRDGADCALSMSRHNGFRMIGVLRACLELCGVDSAAELTEGHREQLPDDLAPLLTARFDPALLLEREMPVADFGRLWSELVVEGVDHLSVLPPRLRTDLSYERLLDAPREELTRLAEFAGVRPLEEWLAAGAALLDGTGRRGSALRLPAGELAAVREACAPGERALGAARAAAGDGGQRARAPRTV